MIATADLLGFMPFEGAVQEHLDHNLYPPMGYLLPQALDAISAAVREEDITITLPGGLVKTGAQIVDGLLLEDFVNHQAAGPVFQCPACGGLSREQTSVCGHCRTPFHNA